MEQPENDLQRAKSLIISGRRVEGEAVINSIISDHPEDHPATLAARFLRARAYEDGMWGEVKTEAAFADFSILKEDTSFFGLEGALGYARLMLRKDSIANAEAAVDLCQSAAKTHHDTRAMMLLGYIYENILEKNTLAERWYLRAYMHGSAWGLRYYAALQMRQKKYLRGILGHILATATSPILVVRFGARDPFK